MYFECSPLLIGFHDRAAIVRAERARRRDRDVHPLRICRVQNDRVQAHPARARLPARPRAMLAQPGQLRARSRRRPST